MQTLLIAGFGDVARRAVPLLRGHWRLLALVHNQQQGIQARTLGVTPVYADLDRKTTLKRLAGLADAVLYTAPPAAAGSDDLRLGKLLSALAKSNSIPQRFVYISTSGVYGNREGAWIDECTPVAPATDRAWRRLAAEQSLRACAQRWQTSITILRAPGIYAAERLPLARIQNSLPLPIATEDIYVNHIHADDLAALCVRALTRRGGIRIYNACDAQPLLSGEWFDALANHFGLPLPPRLARGALSAALSPLQASFLAESRRLKNTRVQRELGVQLRYPDALLFLRNLAVQEADVSLRG